MNSGADRATGARNVTKKTGHDMTESELYGRAKQLSDIAKTANHPMLPKAAKIAIQEAAALIEELATREAKRCREQKTTASQ